MAFLLNMQDKQYSIEDQMETELSVLLWDIVWTLVVELLYGNVMFCTPLWKLFH